MLDLGAVLPGDAGKPPAGSPPARFVLATLVPNSALQFLDFEMAEAQVAHTRRRFLEEQTEGGEASLHVATAGDGVFFHPVTDLVVDPAHVYAIGGIEALAPFLGMWLPVPFMRVVRSGEGEAPLLEEGPSNWVRVHITRQAGGNGGGRFRVVVAVDTAIDAQAAPVGRADVAPTLDDLKSGASFRFSDDVNDIAWFVSEAWVDDWIRQGFADARKRDTGETDAEASGEASDAKGSDAGLAHLAHYLTLLAVLKEACDIPALRFLELNAVGAYADIVPVDLALDLGTSRISALLAERHPPAPGQEPPSPRALPLRDLCEPYRVAATSFSSCLVFSRAVFGNEALSRWSGRTQAFHWPSPVRLGAEAQRLTAGRSAADAITGVSSPLHYLWDEQPSRDVWRYAGPVADGARINPIVSGTFLAHLTEAGELVDGRAGSGAATKPRFSRSSLTTLLVAEVLLHAVSAINAPDSRERGRKPNAARRIARILLTPPAGMGEAETAILRRRAEAAVKLVWQTMGWAGEGHPLAPPPPTVTIAADAGTCVQLAWLDTEIRHKFRGRLDGFLALMGKPRAGFAGARALRVATLDVGAASTGLSVATYEASSGGALAVTRQLVEGFEGGSDDIVKALGERFIVPALMQRLAECRHGDPERLMTALIGNPERGRPAWVGDLGRRIVGEIVAPAGEALLRLYAESESTTGDAPSEPTITTLIASVGGDAKSTADRLDVVAADEGADGFSPLEVGVPLLVRDLAATARDVLRPKLDSVVRVLAALDCDVVLLAGRGAELPVVRDALLEGMPLRPDRVLALHRQRLASLDTGEAAGDRGGDTKALAALGALVQGQAALAGVDLVVRTFDRANAGSFVGCIDAAGLIKPDELLFELQPGCSRTSTGLGGGGVSRSPKPVAIGLPALIGVRVPSIESWPARIGWVIEHVATPGSRPPKLPVRVVLELVAPDRGRAAELRLVSAADGDGGRLDPAEIVLRHKTRGFPDGYWRDTGRLDIGGTGQTEMGS